VQSLQSLLTVLQRPHLLQLILLFKLLHQHQLPLPQ
jgi:hypothetical protein